MEYMDYYTVASMKNFLALASLISADEGNWKCEMFVLFTDTTTYLFSWQSGWSWITFRTLENEMKQCILVYLNQRHLRTPVAILAVQCVRVHTSGTAV